MCGSIHREVGTQSTMAFDDDESVIKFRPVEGVEVNGRTGV
jgi:hypothetical protein